MSLNTGCGGSRTIRYDTTAARLEEFLSWLLSKDTQVGIPGQGRTFRRRTSEFWAVWPMPAATGEAHRVIYVDGIYLARDLVVLIASSDDHVLSWYMARSETSRAWEALLAPIPAPQVVVTDGGAGFQKAARRAWPEARVQRCVFHAFSQVRRYTTSRPRLQAGIELYGLAKELLHLESLRQAEWWFERYMQWCEFWGDFLDEKSWQDGRWDYTYTRLRKARSSLSRLVSQGTLFTYLDPELTREGPLPSTNNRIEGGVNAQLRDLLRNHRGLSLMRRVKAVFWWCYLHTEEPLGAKEVLSSMPTDEDIDFLYRTYSASPRREDGGPEWGDRQGCLGGAPPQGPVSLLAGLAQGHTICPITRKTDRSQLPERPLAAEGQAGVAVPEGPPGGFRYRAHKVVQHMPSPAPHLHRQVDTSAQVDDRQRADGEGQAAVGIRCLLRVHKASWKVKKTPYIVSSSSVHVCGHNILYVDSC